MPKEPWWQTAAQIAGPLMGALVILGLLLTILSSEPDFPPADPAAPVVLEPLSTIDVTVEATTTTIVLPVVTAELYELDHDRKEGNALVVAVRIIERDFPESTFTRRMTDTDIYHASIDTCMSSGYWDPFHYPGLERWFFEIASEFKDPDEADIEMAREWINVLPIVCDDLPPIYQD